MQTIKLNIADNLMSQLMEFIEALPKGSVVVEELNDVKNRDPYFEERKAMIQQRIDDIDSGELKLESFETFKQEMDEFEKDWLMEANQRAKDIDKGDVKLISEEDVRIKAQALLR